MSDDQAARDSAAEAERKRQEILAEDKAHREKIADQADAERRGERWNKER